MANNDDDPEEGKGGEKWGEWKKNDKGEERQGGRSRMRNAKTRRRVSRKEEKWEDNQGGENGNDIKGWKEAK